MFARRLNDLAESKRLVVLEADLHRSLIGLECANLRARLDSARAGIHSGGTWLLAGGAVVGVAAARHWRGLARWVPTALAAWRWVRALK